MASVADESGTDYMGYPRSMSLATFRKRAKLWPQQAVNSTLNELSRMNPVLGMAGVLPSTIKSLADQAGPGREKLLDRWTLMIFCGTLQVWRQRLALFSRRERTFKDSACRSIYHGLLPTGNYRCPCVVPVYSEPEPPLLGTLGRFIQEEKVREAPCGGIGASVLKRESGMKRKTCDKEENDAKTAPLELRRSVRIRSRPAPSYSQRTRKTKDWVATAVAKRKKR